MARALIKPTVPRISPEGRGRDTSQRGWVPVQAWAIGVRPTYKSEEGATPGQDSEQMKAG